jgi:beta-glucosidase
MICADNEAFIAEWSNLRIDNAQDRQHVKTVVQLDVTNAGEWDGAEVVQLYLASRSNAVRRPKRELKAFQKVFLIAGQTQTVSMTLDRLAYSYFDDRDGCWVAEAGTVDIMLCRSSREEDILLVGQVTMTNDIRWTGL